MRALAGQLLEIEEHLRAVEHGLETSLAAVHPGWQESARNLVHYAALRQLDLRELQLLLQQHGLSSLGRAESFVLRSLLEVRLRVAESLCARGDASAADVSRLAAGRDGAFGWQTAEFLLHQHTRAALGPKPADRHVYVMVTVPDADVADDAWVARMLRAGTNLLRINCAHEEPAAWRRILDAVARARRETGLACRVLMDLGGPKIRTGRVASGTRVATWKVPRDAMGRVTAPATVPLRARSATAGAASAIALVLDDDWIAALRPDDVLELVDTRGKRRELRIAQAAGSAAVAETDRRAFVLESTELVHRRGDEVIRRGMPGIVGPSAAFVPLAPGDVLVVTGRDVDGRPAVRDERGEVMEPASIACTLPEALERVAPGHRVLFDDGKIEGVVERVDAGDVHVRIRRAPPGGGKLRAEKGINLPDSDLPVTSLTAEDRAHLEFVARHADLVGLSFVRRPEDVRTLHETLEALGRHEVGVVLKIETRAGFEALPRILLEAMRRPPVAVMIARGDLAVEMGFERLAEVQEEILWLCEACHMPTIWATQVLDTLARSGVPSRAEVTDAAASVAAECVMLNKGNYVEEAVGALADILRRMERHRYKKRSILRPLRVSVFAADAGSA